MLRSRVIPCLLLQNKGLVKTVKFKDPKYVGDPINAVKIFNEKEVDELMLLNNHKLNLNYKDKNLLINGEGQIQFNSEEVNEIKYFVQHYEKITKWMMKDLNKKAQIVIKFEKNHKISSINFN